MSVLGSGFTGGGAVVEVIAAVNARCSGPIVSPGHKINARVSTFSSSRTLPGQEY